MSLESAIQRGILALPRQNPWPGPSPPEQSASAPSRDTRRIFLCLLVYGGLCEATERWPVLVRL